MTWTTRPRSEFGKLRCVEAGRGPLVLFLHGVGLRAEAWAEQLDHFAQTCRVIAPDMPGHGASVPLGHSANLEDYVDLIARAFNEPAVVVGHSMGAMIAVNLAVRYPEKVAGIGALNAIFKRSEAAKAAVQARVAALDGEQIVDPTATLKRWFDDLESAPALACRDWLTAVSPAGYKAAYTVFANEDGPSNAGLGGLKMPSLFMTGALEPNSTPAMSEAMAKLAPRGRAVVLPGAAHMMPMTHPRCVNSELARLMEECSP